MIGCIDRWVVAAVILLYVSRHEARLPEGPENAASPGGMRNGNDHKL
jgi:hypothetical protein